MEVEGATKRCGDPPLALKIKNKNPPTTTERDKQKAMARNTLCTHNKQTE
jgi:hypothetical protein